MDNLLNYTTTPLRYEVEVTRAQLNVATQTPMEAQIRQTRGVAQIQQQQVQVRLDSYERRSSMGFKGVQDFAADAAQRGYQAAMEATAGYAQFGDSIKNIQDGANIPDALFSQMMQRSQGELVLMPISSTDISWMPGSAEIAYQPGTVDTQWNTESAGAQLEWVPGSLAFNIVQYPSIHFEYVGKPIYVPPSAAPDYEG